MKWIILVAVIVVALTAFRSNTLYGAMWLGAQWFRGNNIRVAILWVAVVVVFVFNCVFVGIGTVEFARSDEAQRYYNLYFQGQFKTDAELVWFGGVRSWLAGWGDTLGSWFRVICWTSWFLLAGIAIIYTPFSAREEIGGVVRATIRRFREHRSSPQSAITGAAARVAAAAVPGGSGIHRLWNWLGDDFIADIFSRYIVESGWFRRIFR